MTKLEVLKQELDYATTAVNNLPDWKRVVIERTRQAEEYIGYRRPQGDGENLACVTAEKAK